MREILKYIKHLITLFTDSVTIPILKYDTIYYILESYKYIVGYNLKLIKDAFVVGKKYLFKNVWEKLYYNQQNKLKLL